MLTITLPSLPHNNFDHLLFNNWPIMELEKICYLFTWQIGTLYLLPEGISSLWRIWFGSLIILRLWKPQKPQNHCSRPRSPTKVQIMLPFRTLELFFWSSRFLSFRASYMRLCTWMTVIAVWTAMLYILAAFHTEWNQTTRPDPGLKKIHIHFHINLIHLKSDEYNSLHK